jgi:hypothetical protein
MIVSVPAENADFRPCSRLHTVYEVGVDNEEKIGSPAIERRAVDSPASDLLDAAIAPAIGRIEEHAVV